MLNSAFMLFSFVCGLAYGRLENMPEQPPKPCKQITIQTATGAETFRNIRLTNIVHSDGRFDFTTETGETVTVRGEFVVRDCQ